MWGQSEKYLMKVPNERLMQFARSIFPSKDNGGSLYVFVEKQMMAYYGIKKKLNEEYGVDEFKEEIMMKVRNYGDDLEESMERMIGS